jgi:uncharacterized protein with HEPN domain
MREKVRDNGRLEHILESIDYILDFTKNATFDDFKTDMKLQFAVIKNIEIIGEASYMLTNEFKEQHTEIPWNKIIGSRHILVHGYYQVKLEIIWNIIQNDLQSLKKQIKTIYNTIGK